MILDIFAATLDQCVATTKMDHVVLCSIGDMLPFPKSAITNFVARKIKKMIPQFELVGSVRYSEALRLGSRMVLKNPEIKPDDVAVLHYTGGTTGVSKGRSSRTEPCRQRVAKRGMVWTRTQRDSSGRAARHGMSLTALSYPSVYHEHGYADGRRQECA
ncbi:hypothetical protein QRQ56_33610 [Bradyrhizobium sp. U531]|uniref:hypothetical protein n=1 Tax=Bradyrhizobium sp. U531 TaxID=3053458 RepID=UPI003F43E681